MTTLKSMALTMNATLTRITGYRFTKAAHINVDPGVRAIIDRVRPYTMTGEQKIETLVNAVRYVHRNHIPGSMVECGVWRGGSMQAVALALAELEVRDRDLYLFDTYEGMTEPTDYDVRFDGQTAAERLASHEREGTSIWAYASLDDVQDGFSRIAYPAERVHFVKGPVEETIPDSAPEQIAILRLDTDWYESTAHEFKHLYSRLVPGGVLVLDDYDWWQGARRATDEFMEAEGSELLLLRMGDGRVAVKR